MALALLYHVAQTQTSHVNSADANVWTEENEGTTAHFK